MDLRPVGYVIGLLVATLGATMLFPLALDYVSGHGNWQAFLEAAVISGVVGGVLQPARHPRKEKRERLFRGRPVDRPGKLHREKRYF